MSDSIASRPSSSSGIRRACAAEVADLGAGGPEQPLGEPAVLQRQQPEVEHLQRLLARGERVVVALDQAALADLLERVASQVEHRLRQGRHACGRPSSSRSATSNLSSAERAEHVEDQHAVVRGDRAARLADDHRVRDAARVADACRRDRRRRWRTRAACSSSTRRSSCRAVVVDAEAAADVDVLRGPRRAVSAPHRHARAR
jgi:hypothetical protein